MGKHEWGWVEELRHGNAAQLGIRQLGWPVASQFGWLDRVFVAIGGWLQQGLMHNSPNERAL